MPGPKGGCRSLTDKESSSSRVSAVDSFRAVRGVAARGGNWKVGCLAVSTSSCSSIGDAAPPFDRFRPRAAGTDGGGRRDALLGATGVMGASKPEIVIGSGGASPSSKSIRSVGGTLEAGGRMVGLGVSSDVFAFADRKSV